MKILSRPRAPLISFIAPPVPPACWYQEEIQQTPNLRQNTSKRHTPEHLLFCDRCGNRSREQLSNLTRECKIYAAVTANLVNIDKKELPPNLDRCPDGAFHAAVWPRELQEKPNRAI